jgi:putative ABC transport system permease protein
LNIWQSVRIALTGLLANKLRAALTMLGIIIGVAAVIVLVSIGRGLEKLINDEFNAFGTNLMFIFSVSPGEEASGPGTNTRKALGLSNADAEALENVPGVTDVAPAMQRGAVVIFGGYDSETFVVATTPETSYMRDWNVITGRYITDQDLASEARVAVLGQTVIEDVFTPDVFPLEQTVRINDVPFRVIGVLESKGGAFGQDNDDIIIIPLTTAQNRLYEARRRDGEPEVDVIQVLADPDADPDLIANEIDFILRERHEIRFRGDEDFRVVTQDEFLAAFEQVTGALTAFLGIVAGISLLVGGIVAMYTGREGIPEKWLHRREKLPDWHLNETDP